MLEVEAPMEKVWARVAHVTINFQNLFLRRKILLIAFNSHMTFYIVINNFFVSLRSAMGPTVLHKKFWD